MHVTIPDLGVDEVVDFVVTNKTGFSKPTSEAAVARKNKKYGDRSVRIAEATVFGGIGNGFTAFIKAVSQDSGQRRELREIVSKTIQALNGKILQRRNPRPLATALAVDCSSDEDDDPQPNNKTPTKKPSAAGTKSSPPSKVASILNRKQFGCPTAESVEVDVSQTNNEPSSTLAGTKSSPHFKEANTLNRKQFGCATAESVKVDVSATGLSEVWLAEDVAALAAAM